LSEGELESRIISELEKLGIRIRKKVRIGKWEADFIIETPSRGSIVVEVKNRNIGIPDVLSLASIANNLNSSVTSFSGSIATTMAPSEPVRQAAAKNNIAILTFREIRDFSLKALFICLVAEIEVLVCKIYGLNLSKRIEFRDIVDKLYDKHIIDDESYKELMLIWKIRNKMIHGQHVSEKQLRTAVEKAKKIIEKLKND